MSIECYRWLVLVPDSQQTIHALLSAELLMQYSEFSVGELAQIVEPSLMQHVRRMQNLAQQVLTAGVEIVCEKDREGVDLLLTEIVALGTWCGWNLPLEKTAPPAHPLPLPTSGFLQTGASSEGATLWAIEDQVYLSRSREVTDTADMSEHWGGGS